MSHYQFRYDSQNRATVLSKNDTVVMRIPDDIEGQWKITKPVIDEFSYRANDIIPNGDMVRRDGTIRFGLKDKIEVEFDAIVAYWNKRMVRLQQAGSFKKLEELEAYERDLAQYVPGEYLQVEMDHKYRTAQEFDGKTFEDCWNYVIEADISVQHGPMTLTFKKGDKFVSLDKRDLLQRGSVPLLEDLKMSLLVLSRVTEEECVLACAPA